MSKGLKDIGVGVSCGTIALLLLCIILYTMGFRLNLTPSLPMGVWRVTPIQTDIHPGQYVVFCPTEKAMTLFKNDHKPFLRRRFKCPDNFAPLLKRVSATTGQHVVINDSGVFVDNELVSQISGSIHRIKNFDYVLDDDEVFVLADHPFSVDSRVLGIIDQSRLYATAVPIKPLIFGAL